MPTGGFLHTHTQQGVHEKHSGHCQHRFKVQLKKKDIIQKIPHVFLRL